MRAPCPFVSPADGVKPLERPMARALYLQCQRHCAADQRSWSNTASFGTIVGGQ